MLCLFEYRRYRLTFRVPIRTAHGLWAEREGVIVRLQGESGRVGWGEAAPVPGFGMETVDAVEAACRLLNGKITAESLAALPATLPTLHNALGRAWGHATWGRAEPKLNENSLPAALVSTQGGGAPAGASGLNYSSAAAELDQPQDSQAIAALEAGSPVTSLPVAAFLPAGRRALEIARAKVEDGFRAFKWKVGTGDLEDELGILDDVCALLPTGSKLRLDANGAWEGRQAQRWLERCAERPIEFVEQPVARDARGAEDLLFGLAGDFPTPLALDESLVGEGDLERWLGLGWPGVFVVKSALFACPAKALASLAQAKASVVFSSAMETAVGAQAALEFAFAWPGKPKALGFGVWPLFTNSTCDGPSVAPFIRAADVERLNPEAVWNAIA